MKILTFDIEDWFHLLDYQGTKDESSWSKFEYRIENNLERILNSLNNNNQSATFFCLGWIAREFPHLVQMIDRMGFEIGSHSNMHTLGYDQTRSQFRDDLVKSIESIENLTNKKVKYYRAPGFSVRESNKWIFEELVRQNIEIDCSIFPASRAHGGFKSFPSNSPSIISSKEGLIKELPINTFKFITNSIVFSGGGYFRLLPYPIIKNLVERSPYIMTYFHPRDFDPNQPIIKELNLFRKFKTYVGLKNSFKKFEQLISDFNFVDIGEANKEISWQSTKVINI